MSIDKDRGSGIKWEEALNLLQKIMREEGISEENINGIYFFTRDAVRRKRTSNTSDTFERLSRSTISLFKERLNNGDYYEFSSEIAKLFRNEKKSKIHEYIEDHHIVITITVSSISAIASIAIPIILEFI